MSNKFSLGTILKIENISTSPNKIHYKIQFKGCPLNCIWCDNLELKSNKVEIVQNEIICVHCMACVSDCPTAGIININNQIHLQNKHCIGCMSCVEICPQGALMPSGRKISVKTILAQLPLHKATLIESNKLIQVTLSGGEILSQGPFILSLLKQLKEHDFYTICETTGYGHPEEFKELLTYTDLLHFSLAHYNRQKHCEMTGVSNELILENLSAALRAHKNTIIHIPVVEMINDNLEDAKQFANLLTILGARKVKVNYFKKYNCKTYVPLSLSDIIASQEAQKILSYVETLKKEGLEYSF